MAGTSIKTQFQRRVMSLRLAPCLVPHFTSRFQSCDSFLHVSFASRFCSAALVLQLACRRADATPNVMLRRPQRAAFRRMNTKLRPTHSAMRIAPSVMLQGSAHTCLNDCSALFRASCGRKLMPYLLPQSLPHESSQACSSHKFSETFSYSSVLRCGFSLPKLSSAERRLL